MQITFLGTGGAAQIPVFGCHCDVCVKASAINTLRRKSASIIVSQNLKNLFIDAGLSDLHQRYRKDKIDAFLLTHYHMDHVQGLFSIRWGVGEKIPVFGPDDKDGCDDLFKHPGLLSFQEPLKAFETSDILGMQITPLPLNHSKPTLGYLLTSSQTGRRLAYLTDTSGLPPKTSEFLKHNRPHTLVIDCAYPPSDIEGRNHNTLTQVLAINKEIQSPQTYLTHISHELDLWINSHNLPEGVMAAYDGLVINI
ncbi:phosphonate metabolism protein PhnP [Thorsellia kenyensis]|uniref:Phosphonate metabolism protein PhnP n=1 Tax=Thorsellia kenyensis TaxID=1549888 RepID=A0ABV6C6K6_9GAMM